MLRSISMLLIHVLLLDHSIPVDVADQRFVDLLLDFTDDDNEKAPSSYSVLNMCLTGEKYFNYSTGSFLGPHMASLIVKQVCSSAQSMGKPSIEVISLSHGAGGLKATDIFRLLNKQEGVLILISQKFSIRDSIKDDVTAQQEIVKLLESQHCVGMLGGPKGRSCFIVATTPHNDDDDDEHEHDAADSIYLSALDPHVLLEAPNVAPDTFPSEVYMKEILTVDPLTHTKIKISEMDPCFAVGFYFSNPIEQLEPWRESLEAFTLFSLPMEPAIPVGSNGDKGEDGGKDDDATMGGDTASPTNEDSDFVLV